jgi:hypothetical protein
VVINVFTADDSLTPQQRIAVKMMRRMGANILIDMTPPKNSSPCPIQLGICPFKKGISSKNWIK